MAIFALKWIKCLILRITRRIMNNYKNTSEDQQCYKSFLRFHESKTLEQLQSLINRLQSLPAQYSYWIVCGSSQADQSHCQEPHLLCSRMLGYFSCKRKLSKLMPNFPLSDLTTNMSFAVVDSHRWINILW